LGTKVDGLLILRSWGWGDFLVAISAVLALEELRIDKFRIEQHMMLSILFYAAFMTNIR
jgi:hypothetical protein